MNAYLTNSINKEVYIFQVNDDDKNYTVHMFFNEAGELVNSEISKCGNECGRVYNEGEDSILYKQIIDYINENWNSLTI